MGGKVLRQLLSLTGYLLYALIVAAVLLWLLFPAESVQTWLELQLDNYPPGSSWKIGSVGLAPPGELVLTDIRMESAQSKDVVLTLDRLAFAPVVKSLFEKNKAIKFSMHLLKGVIHGRILIDSGLQQFSCRGSLEGLQPARLNFVRQSLGRAIDGTLAGTFSGKGERDRVLQTQLQGNLKLTGGTLQFRAPVLGLNALPYTKIETDFKRRKGQWLFEQGTLQSPMIAGTFNGSVQNGQTLASSRLQFTGSLTPRSEMFAGLKNTLPAEVIRTHLKDGGLPFTVNGTASAPGIRFSPELSRALNRLQRSTKEP